MATENRTRDRNPICRAHHPSRKARGRRSLRAPRSFAAGQINADYGETRRADRQRFESDLLHPGKKRKEAHEAPTSIGSEGESAH